LLKASANPRDKASSLQGARQRGHISILNRGRSRGKAEIQTCLTWRREFAKSGFLLKTTIGHWMKRGSAKLGLWRRFISINGVLMSALVLIYHSLYCLRCASVNFLHCEGITFPVSTKIPNTLPIQITCVPDLCKWQSIRCTTGFVDIKREHLFGRVSSVTNDQCLKKGFACLRLELMSRHAKLGQNIGFASDTNFPRGLFWHGLLSPFT
jgi:hypothetical protein